MTVQNKIAGIMPGQGFADKGADRLSKSAKNPDFAETFKTAGRSRAEAGRVNEKQNTGSGSVSQKREEAAKAFDKTSADTADAVSERAEMLRKAFSKKSEPRDGTTEAENVNAADVMALMQNFVSEMIDRISEMSGVAEEKIAAAAEEIGMTEADWLDPGRVTELMVELKADGELSELLINEELHAQIAEVTEMISEAFADIAEELGVDEGQLEGIVKKTASGKSAFNQSLRNGVNGAEQAGNAQAEADIQVREADEGHASGEKTAQDNMTGDSGTMLNEVMKNLEQSIAETSDEPQAAQVVRQIIEQIQVRSREDMTSMELQLTPESLGKVNLSVAAKNGVVTAQIATETLAAKEAVEAQISLLKESLNNQGIEIEAVDVVVASHQFESHSEQSNSNGQADGQSGRRRFNDLSGAEDEQKEEAFVLARDIMMSNGNQMDIRT